MYKAKVKWNGDHYSAGFEVKGSKIEKREDGTTWLFDDEPIPEFPFYGDGRDEWVEVDETTVVRLKQFQKKIFTNQSEYVIVYIYKVRGEFIYEQSSVNVKRMATNT